MTILLPQPTPAEIVAARGALSQTAAAALIGVTRNGWAKWESGARKMPPGMWTLYMLATGQHPTHRVDQLDV